MKYKFNKDKLSVIDTEEKAYWLGFIWCDGYNGIRNRNNKTTYEFKLSLQVADIEHLGKFKLFMESTHPIKIYESKTSFKKDNNEARILIASTPFGKLLDEKYGLIPHRTDVAKLIKNIPNNLLNHFIRGVLDADGSFSSYTTKNGEYIVTKHNLQFTTNIGLLDFINKTLYDEGLSKLEKRNYYQRHENADGDCRTLMYSGKPNCQKILDWIYKDATIYLDRKYKKYIEVFKE